MGDEYNQKELKISAWWHWKNVAEQIIEIKWL